VVAKLRGQEQNAIALLKQAVQIEPRLTGAAAILGELLYRQGDLDLAITIYERALAGAPPSAIEGMRERLEAWRQEASLPQNHHAIKDDRFTIGFDGPMQQKLAARATSGSSTTSWVRPNGRMAVSTDRFGSRSAAPRRISRGSIAC
jgi:tetratricopeptide (TPR) repeat protein